MKKLKVIIAIAIVASSIQFTSCEKCSRSVKTISSNFSGLYRTTTPTGGNNGGNNGGGEDGMS